MTTHALSLVLVMTFACGGGNRAATTAAESTTPPDTAGADSAAETDEPRDPTPERGPSEAKRAPAKLKPYKAFEADNGQWGYRDGAGKIAIKPRFGYAQDFTDDGIASAVLDGSWRIIDEQGEPLLKPFIYDNGPDYFESGLARLVANGKMGFFDTRGNIVIPAQYDFAAAFTDSNGDATEVAAVCKKCKYEPGDEGGVSGGKWGYIDKQGTVVIPLKYKDPGDVEDGLIKLKRRGKVLVFDLTGKRVR